MLADLNLAFVALLTASGAASAAIVASSLAELPLPNIDEVASRGYDLLRKSNDTSSVAPHFLREYGTQGVNYDLEANGDPFIFCQVGGGGDIA